MSTIDPDRSAAGWPAGARTVITVLLALCAAFAANATHAQCGPLPQPDGPVYAMTGDSANQVLYIGGDFANVVGATPAARDHLAAIDLETCEVTPWDPNPGGPVRTMWLSEDDATLYVGGEFTTIGGQNRDRLAAVATSTGLPTTWNPAVNGTVHEMIPSAFASSFYVGGAFTTVNGALRHGFVEVTRLNGTVVSPRFGFDVGASVRSLTLGDNRVYLGGDFTTVTTDFDPDAGDGSAERLAVAAIDLEDYVLAGWSAQIEDGSVEVLRIAPDLGAVYAGGNFTSVAGAARNGIAALDPATGALQTWNPQVDAIVRTILPSFDRSLLFLGGDFSAIGGVARDRLAAVLATDASLVAGLNLEVAAPACALHRTEDSVAEEYRLYAAGGDCAATGVMPAGLLAGFAVPPPEEQPPLTTAQPPGGLFNNDNVTPIVLDCNDFAGSGCAATYFTTDGSTPDIDSQVYTSPINLTADLVLNFFSVDQVGNVEPVTTETYDVETTPPVTTASPASRVFEGEQLDVELSCTDSDSGCAATYYTTDGSQPTTSSSLYSGPLVLTGTTVLQYFSVDVAGNTESIGRQEYVRNRGEIGAFSGVEALLILAVVAVLGRRGWRRC